ncbi:MAG TPA: phenylalanine--tRNA ligase subunit beta, partial [Candidatus Bathyarchaeia archaeon]|nr:phenylalanine--tRNA ligase subunit beta [Candidatus Bathyarchaeia archaeon]
CFDPVLIRRTSRKLGLASDSSYRFERGVVFDHVKTGADRAVDLILQYAGGSITQRADILAGKKPAAPKSLVIHENVMNGFLGVAISLAQARRVLTALGFWCGASGKKALKVVPPCFRSDIKLLVDVYEEIARVVGFEHIPSSFPTVRSSGMPSNQHRRKRLEIVDLLRSQGFNETVTYSLLSKELATAAGVEAFSHMAVLNPLSKEQEILRPHLLPSLLQTIQININRGQKDLAFFETGKIYPQGGEKEALGMMMTGWLRRDWRDSKPRPFDFYDLKGSVEKMLSQFGAGEPEFRIATAEFLEEGQRADVVIGNKVFGVCGRVADEVLKNFDIKQHEVFFAQIDLEALYEMSEKQRKYVPVCEYPSIVRDVSLAAPKDVAFEQIRKIIREHGSELLSAIHFKEEYLGEKIPQGQRGLVFSIVYQSRQRTLTEEEIQVVHKKICDEICVRLCASLR